MQADAAYFVFMLGLIEVGLSVIVAGLLSVAICVAATWIWSPREQSDKSLIITAPVR
jgi:hypothetical protein